MSILISSDLHLTDNPRDEYRWGLFEWMRVQIKKHGVKIVALLGDLTDAKDRHPSMVVNRLAKELYELQRFAQVIVLKGNHDYVDEAHPFFGFANLIGDQHLVSFLTNPLVLDDLLFLPNTRNYERDWAGMDFKSPRLIFTHQTYDGSIVENGTKLGGIPPSIFGKTKAQVISGDIHVPQKVSRNVQYVGAPYRIRFGDSYEPRVLLIKENGSQVDLHYQTVVKHLREIRNVTSIKEIKRRAFRGGASDGKETGLIYAGDQVKVRVWLKRKDYDLWPKIRAAIVEEAKECEVELTGPELRAIPSVPEKAQGDGPNTVKGAVSPKAALSAYADTHKLSKELRKAGESLLHKAVDEIGRSAKGALV